MRGREGDVEWDGLFWKLDEGEWSVGVVGMALILVAGVEFRLDQSSMF